MSSKYSQYVYVLVFASLAEFCLLTSLVYASWLSIYSPPPLLNSCLLSVLLAYLNKMGTFHWFLLILSVSSIYCYNEEEEEAYLVVKPSISSFVNGSTIVQTPPTTRRPYNAPRMPDLTTTTTRMTTGTSSTTSTTPRLPGRQRRGQQLQLQSRPSCRLSTGILTHAYGTVFFCLVPYRITVPYLIVPYCANFIY